MTELYLYQTIHLAGGRPRLVGAHIALLDEASRTLFNRPYSPDLRQLTTRLAGVADAEGYPHGVSSFIRLEISAEGAERIIPAGISLYSGYALRSLAPDAATVYYNTPLSEAPTSVREASAQLAQRQVMLEGAQVALRCNSLGVCLTADDAPLFAVKGGTLFTAPAYSGAQQEQTAWAQSVDPNTAAQTQVFPSVERDVALHAIRAAGLPLREEAFEVQDLSTFDELFYVDHRGVTALAHCDQLPFRGLLSERIATALEELFTPRS